MRGAYGKPIERAARVSIGQPLFSIRCKEQHVKIAVEALRRSKHKFPGQQRIFVSQMWGFTQIKKVDYTRLQQEG
jgi:large subunit ribosomal protein L10e